MRALVAVVLALGLAARVDAYASAPPYLQANDPVRVWATLSTTDVAVGETVVLELHVETKGPSPERITVPTLPDAIEVVGTRDYSQLQFSLPGGRSRLIRREIVLRPGEAGSYRIPAFEVRVQGETYRTNALTLRVIAAATPPSRTRGAGPGDDSTGGDEGMARGPGGEVLFSVVIRPDTVFLGQQATLYAEVLVSEEAQLRLRRSPEYVPPDGTGFWVQELPAAGGPRPRVIDGRIYYGRTLTRAYFPLSPGDFALDPAKLKYEIRRGLLYSPQDQELTSGPIRLTVLPLPDSARPESFTGAVGRFTARARLEPDRIPAGEAVALILEVEGEGNVKGLPPPPLPDLAGVQLFPPSEEAEVSNADGIVRGTKRFTWVLVPERPGRLELPGIEYAFFDPERGEYDIARTSPLALEVFASPTGDAPEETVEEPIRYLRSSPAGPSPLRWVRSPAFAAVLALPLVAFAALGAGRRRAERPRPPSRRALRQRRVAAFHALRQQADGEGGPFFHGLGSAIRAAFADLLADATLSRVAAGEAEERLVAHGVERATAHSLAQLLARVDRARFEPVPPGKTTRRAILDDAERLLDRLDREMRPHRNRSRAGRTAVLVVLLIGAGAEGGYGNAYVDRAAVAARIAPPERATASADRVGEADFRRGTERYARGDYRGAGDAFAAYVAANPADPNGWYNLGNAYFLAGEPGRAGWAWLRALRLAPRDADVRHNLRVARIDPWLVRQTLPRLPLTTEELVLLAGITWLIGGFAAIRFRARRGRIGLGLAGLGLASSLLLGGVLAEDAFRKSVGIVLQEGTGLQAAPAIHAETIRILGPGTAVRLVERRGEWLRVRLPAGGEGWVEADRVAPTQGAPPAL